MPVMAGVESAFCRSAPWRLFARRVIVPWALRDAGAIAGRVLEVGAGSGAMAAEVLARHPTIQLLATDVDRDMVVAARRRLRPFGARADVLRADAMNLPFDDASFDTVCSWLMLHHTLQWEACLSEAVRVLRPGGWLLGYDLTDTAAARVIHRLDRSPHRLASPEELHRTLSVLPVTDLSVASRAIGHVVRFAGRAAMPQPFR